jgi:squalene-hopene/tetraprenyl-beta-curcumene cyclase
MVEDGDRLRPEACQSPIWDTGLAVLALRAAGVAPDNPQLRKAGEWLLAEEVTVKGDWAIRRPNLAPGGWAFEFENDRYPDIDDAAVVALALRELGLGEDAVRRSLDWVEGMQSANGGWGAFDADNSSYWLYKLPFCDFGYVIDPPSEDVSAHALEALAPAGWAFEFENDLYPDVDDTAVVALALRELGMGDEAVHRGLDWIEGMQSRNGGWGAFDADNSSYWLYKLPFCDFGYVIDPPSEDVSAHALEVLAPEGRYADSVARGVDYLVREQQWDGSWWGRWGVNHVYGTGAVLPALEACGFEPAHAVMRKGVEWLDSVQHGGGGFGEDIRSYHETAMRGRGSPTASQTAWALLGYVAAGEWQRASARRAADYLCAEQEVNGDWSEEHYTGTGFPTDFMIRYHLYRLHFPLLALGRLRERLNA